jgi:hypothetical protein
MDCPERNRISRAIAVTIRDLHRVKRERGLSAAHETAGKIDTFFLLSHNLAKLRTEYQKHVESHRCLGVGSDTRADKSGTTTA